MVGAFAAARRMKGVVRPHAMPTRRKPRIQWKTEGEAGGWGASGSVVGMAAEMERGKMED